MANTFQPLIRIISKTDKLQENFANTLQENFLQTTVLAARSLQENLPDGCYGKSARTFGVVSSSPQQLRSAIMEEAELGSNGF